MLKVEKRVKSALFSLLSASSSAYLKTFDMDMDTRAKAGRRLDTNALRRERRGRRKQSPLAHLANSSGFLMKDANNTKMSCYACRFEYNWRWFLSLWPLSSFCPLFLFQGSPFTWSVFKIRSTKYSVTFTLSGEWKKTILSRRKAAILSLSLSLSLSLLRLNGRKRERKDGRSKHPTTIQPQEQLHWKRENRHKGESEDTLSLC